MSRVSFCCICALALWPVAALSGPGPLALRSAAEMDFLPRHRTLLRALEARPDDGVALVGLAELYLSRGWLPEALSLLDGPFEAREPTSAARWETLSLAAALLGAAPDDALAASEGWPEGAALRVHALMRAGRIDAARALREDATRSLDAMPPELAARVLPDLLDLAIAEGDWAGGGVLAARFADHPDLDAMPSYWLRLGRAAEARGEGVMAFEGYLRASRGADADAHRARLVLVRLGVRTDTLPPDDLRRMLESARWAWRGDEVALDGLSMLAQTASQAGDTLGALSALAQILRDFEADDVRTQARARAETLISEFYADRGMSLGDLLDGHAIIESDWRFEPAFLRHAGTLPQTLLDAGMTAAAARAARGLRELTTVSEELGLRPPDPALLQAIVKIELAALLRGGQVARAGELAAGLDLAEPDAGLDLILDEIAARGGGGRVPTEGTGLRMEAERAFDAADWDGAHTLYLRYWEGSPEAFAFRDAVRLMIAARRMDRPDTIARLAGEMPGLTDLGQWDEIVERLARPDTPDAAPPPLSRAGTEAAMARAARMTEATDSLSQERRQ